jgi:hypothetical protein
VLEIRFTEPHWYKGKCKYASVRPFFLYGLPDTYLYRNNKDF